MKRIIAVITALMLIISMVPAVNAAQVVNYTVYAASSRYYVTNDNNSNFGINVVTQSQVTTAKGAMVSYGYGGPLRSRSMEVGGYSVLLPPSSTGGYLLIVGYYPIGLFTSSTGWVTATAIQFPSTSLSYKLSATYYRFADTPYLLPGTDNGYGQSFDGVVYIPPHTGNLYLQVYSYFDSMADNDSSTLSYGIATGVGITSTALINFIPDSSSGLDYSSLLQSILGALNSMNSNQAGFETQLSQILTALNSILSSLQSNGGNVAGIVSALDDVNSKLQSTLDQITSSGVDDDFTQQILDDMDQLMDKIDDLTQQIEDNSNRPPPEDIVPSIPPQLLPPTDETAIAGRDAISGILSSSFFVTFLLMVFTLAFLRYVLFGKSR